MTWSAGTTIVGTPVYIVSSGTKIYWARRGAGQLSDDIYEYDPDTDTATLIIQKSAITNYFDTRGLAWFNGNLYILARYNTGSPTFDSSYLVQQWTGVTNGLTTVDTVVTEPTANIGYSNLYVGDGLMVVAYVPEVVGNHLVHYTSDGSNWSTGDFGGFSPRVVGNDTKNVRKQTTEYPLGIYDDFCTNSVGPDCTETRLLKFVETGWTSIKVQTSSGHFYRQGTPNGEAHWVQLGAATFTPDFVVYTDASESFITQVREINMPWMPGVNIVDATLQQFNGTTFDEFEAFSPLAFSSPDDSFMVRLDNNMLYYIAPEDFVGAWIVAKSSVPLVDTGGNRLWVYKTTDTGISWVSRGVKT